MRRLLRTPYIPFGTQYYRAPSPAPSEWEGDLARIAASGFTMVKYWVQWRWNTPREGHYKFDDIDRLMDIAAKHRLNVMLNTIVDVAPVWIYRTYPDASMRTLDGRRIGPQVQPHRQIGGLGLCFNHAPAMDHMADFLRATVRRYADHPALAVWNVASEPELTSSMAELRLYADNAAGIGDMLCYCDRCTAAFRRWCAEKYRRIEHLNVVWNRNYQDFEEIEVPTTRNSFNDMIDWRMFFVHTLGENVRRRFEIAREEDRGRHPLMCHHVFVQGFPVTSTANDPWNVGQYGDLHAITQMDDPMMCDILRCSARGKPVISAEMLMLFGYTLDMPKPVEENDIKRFVFNGVGANLKGFIFWQYRPETLAREAPAWGLTHLDGSRTPWLEGFENVNRVLQRNADLLLDASPAPAEVALLYSPQNQVFGWAATGNEKNVTDSLLGTHRALYERNIVVDFIHPREITPELLSRYKVIIVPFPYFLGEALCAELRRWVARGGVLIGESYFAGWNVERGAHHTTVPGYALHEVFAARQLRAGPPDVGGAVELEVACDLPHLRKGTRLEGMLVRETFTVEGAEVLARFPSGEPAATCARHGEGHAMLVGSYLGLAYHRRGQAAIADFIVSLVDLKARIVRPTVSGGGMVRIDMLTAPGGGMMLIVRNLLDKPSAATLRLPGVKTRTLTDQFSGEQLLLAPAEGGAMTAISLQGSEVKVYCG